MEISPDIENGEYLVSQTDLCIKTAAGINKQRKTDLKPGKFFKIA